jgi:hypothetical protein
VRIVDAVGGDPEAVDDVSCHDVLVENLVDVFQANCAVPDPFRINDDAGAMLALVEATAPVGADAGTEAAALDRLFEGGAQLFLSKGIAATARVIRLALVPAHENVMGEVGHVPIQA